MKLNEHITSALGQVAFALVVGSLVYGAVWIFYRPRLDGQSLFSYLGLKAPNGQLDKTYWWIWSGVVVFGIISTFVQFRFSESIHQMLMSENSPYGKILSTGFDSFAILKALIYCFIQASCAEEILFRGLFANRLINAWGKFVGNILQALLFWLMHFLIFRLVTGEWFSSLQLFTFLFSFGLGLVLGYVNFRKNGRSIVPSWILHGSANFASFLTLAILWPSS